MSRVSVKTFLCSAKKHLQQAERTNGKAAFVIGNESADLDSIVCALLYGYVQSSTLQARRADRIVVPVTNIPASDLPLRPELTALLKHADLQPSDLITLDDLGKLPLPLRETHWTLVDHNSLLGEMGKYYSQYVSGVIDHHDDENKVPKDAVLRVIEKSGSCSSLVTNYCHETWEAISSRSSSVGAANAQDQGIVDDSAYTSTWDAQVAKLALGAVLIDTINLKDESKVTTHDEKAVRYLEALINSSAKISRSYERDKFYQEINDAKSNLDGLSLDDILRKDYKQWSEGDLTLGISCSVKPMDYLQSKDSEFLSVLSSFAKTRRLDVFGIMTAYTNDSDDFARQLLLVATADGESKAAAERFFQSSAKELQLEDCQSSLGIKSVEGSEFAYGRVWDQRNKTASRKEVGPLLREAMR